MVVDKNGKELHIKDQVMYEVRAGVMGESSEKVGIILNLLPNGMLLVQPDEGGVPDTVDLNAVTLKYSLVADVMALETDEDFQKMMLEAEKRFATEKMMTKTSSGKRRVSNRASTGSRSATRKITTSQPETLGVELDL